jgi:hypothetical protein
MYPLGDIFGIERVDYPARGAEKNGIDSFSVVAQIDGARVFAQIVGLKSA